ncbi:mycofactocin system glycosyltransferase [Thiorhodovibrio winogradskyi]|uniref:Mycofactocin system glycosyltransferase n=1 Tax=Thiorhodovibrio winogradskyi TaxID=77007 RepID=A0ABZ0SDI2_9GAMM|nr:glycosyltransferase [Thiorhodovibrio winogradskyi]
MPQTSSPTCIGAITALHGNLVTGWAYDPSAPDLRLAIEIDIDGACVALIRADQLQDRTQASIPVVGDGCHGFSCELKTSWLSGAKRLSARIANQGPWLAGGIAVTEAQSETPAPPRGQVYYLGGLRLSGWLYDPADWDRVLSIRIREGTRILAEPAADQPERTLSDRPNSNHGFRIDLPWALADGSLHHLEVETEDGKPLPGSPLQLLELPDSFIGLLRRHWFPLADPAAARLLESMVRQHQRQCPSLLGFSHYPHWRNLHQQPCAKLDRHRQPRLGVLLYAPVGSDEHRQERSRASLNDQQLAPTQVACVDDASLFKGLRHLLAANPAAIALLQVGDRLAPDALARLANALFDSATGRARAAWAYSDCDRDGPGEDRIDPWLKPAWDPNLFLGVDIISSGALFGAPILRETLDALARAPNPLISAPNAPGTSWHWLLAALVATTQAHSEPVLHLPEPLYWRAADSPPDPAQRPASPARQQAIQWLAQQWVPGARVRPCAEHPGLLQVTWPLPAPPPRVSLIIPTRDGGQRLRTCIQGLLEHTRYPNLELIVVDNESRDSETLAYLNALTGYDVTILRYPHPFNYSAINNMAVAQASGDLIGLVNDDIEILEPDWLVAMVSELTRPGIGMVGAKLLWSNAMVQHAGVIVGINGLAAHVGNHWQDTDAGYLGCNQVSRRYSAVTAACLLTHKQLFIELGGLDADTFPVAFNDVDLCLRLRERGLAIIWTPAARLRHAESASRGKDETRPQIARAQREQRLFIERWGKHYPVDPCYHPCLNHDWLTGPFAGLPAVPFSRAPRVQTG